MQHLGKKVYLAVAQQPFEYVGDAGIANTFATLVPLVAADGEVLHPSDFGEFGMVFWMVRQHALKFANPGRLIAGTLEGAVSPGRLEYQLAPYSADVVSPSDLVEVLQVEHEDVRELRDLFNVDSVILLDHPPTSLVLVHWRDHVYGPFRAESRPAQAGRTPWSVTLRAYKPDVTVYNIPASDLCAPDKFGPYYRSHISARITYESRYEYWERTSSTPTHICHYSLLLGAGFKKLPSMGYPTVSVETDRELVIRYAKAFLSRKQVQQLRELLPVVDPVLDARWDTAGNAGKQVVEAIRCRADQLDDELTALARSLVVSGLIDDYVAGAVEQKVQEHINQQAATILAEIAAKVSSLRNELDTLERKKEALESELEFRHRQSQREIEQMREEFEKYKRAEEASLQNARRDLDQQRATLSRHFEAVIERYKTAGTKQSTTLCSLHRFFSGQVYR
jgi:Chromosome segregation ATPases